MTDQYADIRAALDAATPGPWEWRTEICERGPVGKGNTIRVSLSAPRNSHAHARTAVLAPNWNTSEGDVWQAWISCNEANAAYIAACHPEVIRALLAERDALRAALEVAIAQMEHDATQIDGEWGDCRSIDQLERDGELPEALVLARTLLARYGNNPGAAHE